MGQQPSQEEEEEEEEVERVRQAAGWLAGVWAHSGLHLNVIWPSSWTPSQEEVEEEERGRQAAGCVWTPWGRHLDIIWKTSRGLWTSSSQFVGGQGGKGRPPKSQQKGWQSHGGKAGKVMAARLAKSQNQGWQSQGGK